MQTVEQRRSIPRRAQQFPVYFCLPEEGADTSSQNVFADGIWREGCSVDIGGGGLRFRTEGNLAFPRHITLRFTLLLHCKTNEADPVRKQSFCLQGRVLRTTPNESHPEQLEVAVHFERMTVAEGCTLAAYLAA